MRKIWGCYDLHRAHAGEESLRSSRRHPRSRRDLGVQAQGTARDGGEIMICGVAQLVVRSAVNREVTGSRPVPTEDMRRLMAAQKRTSTSVLQRPLGASKSPAGGLRSTSGQFLLTSGGTLDPEGTQESGLRRALSMRPFVTSVMGTRLQAGLVPLTNLEVYSKGGNASDQEVRRVRLREERRAPAVGRGVP